MLLKAGNTENATETDKSSTGKKDVSASTHDFSIASLTNTTSSPNTSVDSGIGSPNQSQFSIKHHAKDSATSGTPVRNTESSELFCNLEELPRGEDGKFHCPVCNKGFNRRFYLIKAHINIHSNAAPYQCRKCHRCFKDSSNRRSHERICQKPENK
ncbi:unnamed protein product [Bursaphelenchus okinawaensis]|uniref:C2H2-type domain-containing protein n=1 Tax=Bursaphelenchus okinawaensis TaxID=465554 RepID=A0A811L655_9BILA|nr:unnamed protein product [Bursaphelenchus okinawaensis]CAG9117351.1 unnamed protein product [Bursaphelenchus okinawaensis]